MTQTEFNITSTSSPTPDDKRAEIMSNPGFGRYFTDHMAVIDYSPEEGWHNARIQPYSSISLDPATSVLHYGQAIFEGIKAYKQADGSVKTFRPEKNARRLQTSAARIAMPKLPEELFEQSLKELVAIDSAWVPAAGGEESLYLRPFMISTETTLGVKPAKTYSYYVIASPAGAYFSGGINPVTVWLSQDYVRAAPGGTGAAKFAGNYAASLRAQAEAADEGCDQVVWLDALEHKYVEEMGGMNLFFVYGEGDSASLVTPELSGSLLPGVTRDSILQVGKDFGMDVQERKISIQEWEETARSGELSEVFACGTAAVVTPVGHVKYKGGEFDINGTQTGPITLKIRETLTGIQKGEVPDTHNWMVNLVESPAE